MGKASLYGEHRQHHGSPGETCHQGFEDQRNTGRIGDGRFERMRLMELDPSKRGCESLGAGPTQCCESIQIMSLDESFMEGMRAAW